MLSHTLSAYVLLLAGSYLAAAASCWRDTACTGPAQPAFRGPWEDDNFSPSSRKVSPVQVLDQGHNFVSNWPGIAELDGSGSMRIFDFGKEVGGILTVQYSACGTGSLGLAFSESRNFTGTISDESNGGSGPDGGLSTSIVANKCVKNQNYVTPDAQLRGGFRYLTLFATATGPVLNINITKITLQISFQPTWPNLRAYQGYFHSSDHVLNKIWYAGAYTLQTNTIPSDTGRVFPCLNTGWNNAASLGTNAPAVIVDGAKRDRAIWNGDLGIATRTAFVSTGDQDSVKNAILVAYQGQQGSGEFPMVGPPINFFGSDTYHMSTLIGTYDYMLFSGDTDFLNAHWSAYKAAVAFVVDKIDSNGLMVVTGTNNWGRTAFSGGHATDGNMLLYRVLTTAAIMAQWQDDQALSATYTAQAESLKTALNQQNWDSAKGAFKNNDGDASIYPEDGNSMALYFNGTNPAYVSRVSEYLQTNWGPIGAVTPELPGNVVPYIESFEVKAHLVARQPKRALDLIRLSWGWYLASPFGTQSTCIEGYYSDGSFFYRDPNYSKNGAYTSHSHGWSTGPTDALTSYIAGLQPTGPGGKTWLLEPQFGDLTFAQAGFSLPMGKFSAAWNLTDTGYTVTVNVPVGTTGLARLPFLPNSSTPSSVIVNRGRYAFAPDADNKVILLSLKGGKSSITVA